MQDDRSKARLRQNKGLRSRHAGLQEQQGLYGAFIINPLQHPSYHYTKDYTVILSDWSNTNPNKILSNLKKEGDYYSANFPLQPSLVKFIQDYRKASVQEKKTPAVYLKTLSIPRWKME